MRGANYSLTDEQHRAIADRAKQTSGNRSRALRSLIDHGMGKCYRLRNQARAPLKEIAAGCLQLRRQHPMPHVLAIIERIERAGHELEDALLKSE